jgi:hypothetical protein
MTMTGIGTARRTGCRTIWRRTAVGADKSILTEHRRVGAPSSTQTVRHRVAVANSIPTGRRALNLVRKRCQEGLAGRRVSTSRTSRDPLRRRVLRRRQRLPDRRDTRGTNANTIVRRGSTVDGFGGGLIRLLIWLC